MNHDAVAELKEQSLALVAALDHDPLVGAVISGEATRAEYLRFLEATYHYVRWSGPLLAATAAGLRRRGRYPWLTALVAAKADEEAPHDRWALADLGRCGGDVAAVQAAPLPTAVAAYVEWSLAMAEAGSPAFLGCAYALEFISMSRAQRAADNLRARGAIAGIDQAVSFLAGHGDADPAHVALLEDVLRGIDEPADRDAMLVAAGVLRLLYPGFFRSAPSARAPSDGSL
jgi:heme oxygenase-like protein